jgi:hypothetical protein
MTDDFQSDDMIACCGLDCTACDIRRCPGDPKLRDYMTEWFRNNVDPKAEESWFHCAGCHGNRTDHWSPDCWILVCCVDERQLHHCSECSEFPCGRLVKWSKESEKYGEAFRRLQGMGDRDEGAC